MAFAGKWKRSASENSSAAMRYIGMSDEVIEALEKEEGNVEIKQNGDVITQIYNYGGKEVKQVYTLQKESNLQSFDGKEIKVIPERITDKKFKVAYTHNGIHYSAIREIVDDNQMIDVVELDHGKVVGKTTYTKC